MVTILLAVIVDFQMSFGWSFPKLIGIKRSISRGIRDEISNLPLQIYREILMNLASSFLILYIERPKKTWSQTVSEDVNALSIQNVDLLNRLVWQNALKTAASMSNPLCRET